MTINLLGIVGFSFNKNIAAELGYRYVSIDFKENDFLYDVSMYGFVIGLGIHF
jgi:opacity protein-like surface antigen